MCGGGSRPAPPPPAPPPPQVQDTGPSVDELTDSEKMRKGRKATVLTDTESQTMENIKKKKLLGEASEKLAQY